MTRLAGSSGAPADKKSRIERLLRELDELLTEEYDDSEDPAVSTLQRYSRRAGDKIAQEWQTQREDWRKERLPESQQYPKRLHVTMDGVQIHVNGGWHEAKIGAVYELDSSSHAVNTRFTASMETSFEFGKRLPVLAHRGGIDHCRDVEVVADGGPWIWQETGKYF